MWNHSYNLNLTLQKSLYLYRDILIYMEALQSTEMYFKQVHTKKSLKTTLERNFSFVTFVKTL